METQAMTIRLPKDLYEQLRLAAFEDRTSQAAIITEAVTARLAARKPRDRVCPLPDCGCDGTPHPM